MMSWLLLIAAASGAFGQATTYLLESRLPDPTVTIAINLTQYRINWNANWVLDLRNRTDVQSITVSFTFFQIEVHRRTQSFSLDIKYFLVGRERLHVCLRFPH
jgi:hypothetical protein